MKYGFVSIFPFFGDKVGQVLDEGLVACATRSELITFDEIVFAESFEETL
jgi:hypothetical protein